jgi:hypothetical protein
MDGKLSLNDAISQIMNTLAIAQSGKQPHSINDDWSVRLVSNTDAALRD